MIGRPIAAGELAHPLHLAFGRGEVFAERAGRRELEHAGAELAEHAPDAEQLVVRGERSRNRLTVDRHVRDRATRREAERAGFDAALHEVGHLLDVGRGRRLVLGAALPHHVAADRAVRHLRADVEEERLALDRVEVLGERLPLPLDARRQRGTGNVFDAFHQSDEPLVAVGVHRREPDAAVAHHDRGHAVPARGREHRVPGDLAVEVRVHVDEAGRHERAVGIDRLARELVDATDLGDDTVGDRDVGGTPGRAGSVDDRSTLDHEIVHQCSSLKKALMSSTSRSGSSSAAK